MDPSEVLTEYFTNLLHETHFNPSQDNTDSRGGNMLQLLQLSRVVVPLYKVDGLFSLFAFLSSPLLSFENGGQRKTCHRFLFFFSQRDERTHAKTTQVIQPNKAPSFHGYTFQLLVHPLNSRAESRLCRYRVCRFSFSLSLPFSLLFNTAH